MEHYSRTSSAIALEHKKQHHRHRRRQRKTSSSCTLLSILVLFLTIINSSISSSYAQQQQLPQSSSTTHPACCICQDNCVSSITIPDAIIALPADINNGILTAQSSSSRCADLQQAAQIDRLFSKDECTAILASATNLPRDCGCSNYNDGILATPELPQTNPPCYLCGDGGISIPSRPEEMVALTTFGIELLGEYKEASCEQIRSIGEDLQQISVQQCPQLDRNDLRLICGCPNAIIPTVTPSTAVDRLVLEEAEVVLPTLAPTVAAFVVAWEETTAIPISMEAPPTFMPANSYEPPFVADETTKNYSNPVCWVCFDNGISNVSNPEAIVELPPEAMNLTGGVPQVSCAQIQSVAEVMRLVPADLCPLLDRNDLRLACGCANAVITNAPQVLIMPMATPTTNPPAPMPSDNLRTSNPIPISTNPPAEVVVPAPVPMNIPEQMPFPDPTPTPVSVPAVPTPVNVPAPFSAAVPVPIPQPVPVPIPQPFPVLTAPASLPTVGNVPAPVSVSVPTASVPVLASVPLAQVSEPTPMSLPSAFAPAPIVISVPTVPVVALPTVPVAASPGFTEDALGTLSPAGDVTAPQPPAPSITLQPSVLVKNVIITAFPTMSDGTVGLTTSKQQRSPMRRNSHSR